ncbi:hypothetical protein [Nocardia sp. NPDC057668]|uniref:hypothetical protein n=1 Tax=Nocardia sp. NPDC057668 TaxID=3346202 RepID=UPI00366D7E9E
MVTALIAVAGTLLGSIVTHVFQRMTADRTTRQNFADRLRQDRLSAYNAFAASAIEYRHHQIERWHRLRQNPDTEVTARSESYSKKVELRSELVRVKLLTSDPRIQDLADHAIEAIRAIQRSGVAPASPEDHAILMKKANNAIEDFVAQAARDVQAHEQKQLSQRR